MLSRAFGTFRVLRDTTTSSSPVPETSSSSQSSFHAQEPLVLFPSLDSISQADLTLSKNSNGSAWYRVSRTKANQLPVYADVRANGHRTTIIRRIEGSVPLLKQDLRTALGLGPDDIKIKPTSGQIKIKGDHVNSVKRLLSEAKF